MTDQERLLASVVNRAAVNLIVAESMLMEAPIIPEEINVADIGNLLDAAHEFVHRFHERKTR